jgi:hypothetical protein
MKTKDVSEHKTGDKEEKKIEWDKTKKTHKINKEKPEWVDDLADKVLPA